jgi:uncharacterized protein (DUF305 family)
MSKYLAISLVIVALILGIGIGFYASPNFLLYSDSKTHSTDLGKADKYVDLRYINAMIAHHRGAMLMAEQAKNESKRTEIVNLANDILTNEPKLIDELYKWKKDMYGDTSIVKDPEVAKLGTADDRFDLRFLNALIAHHEEGMEMTQVIRRKSSRNEILNNADAVESFLEKSSISLKELRKSWYNID